MDQINLCVFCKHFDWSEYEYTFYSTLTGGEMRGGLNCKRGYFYCCNPKDTEGFRAVILRAGTCPEYLPDNGA